MKKILFLLTILALSANIAVSGTTASDMSSYQELRNQGFSTETARLININKRDGSVPLETETKPQNKFVKGVNVFFNYFDPGRASENFGRRDIKPGTGYTDL